MIQFGFNFGMSGDDWSAFQGKWCIVSTHGGLTLEGCVAKLTRRSVTITPLVVTRSASRREPTRYEILDQPMMLPRHSIAYIRVHNRQDSERHIAWENEKMRRTHEREVGNYQ